MPSDHQLVEQLASRHRPGAEDASAAICFLPFDDAKEPSAEKFSDRYHLAPVIGSKPTTFSSAIDTTRTPCLQPIATYLPWAVAALRRDIGR